MINGDLDLVISRRRSSPRVLISLLLGALDLVGHKDVRVSLNRP